MHTDSIPVRMLVIFALLIFRAWGAWCWSCVLLLGGCCSILLICTLVGRLEVLPAGKGQLSLGRLRWGQEWRVFCHKIQVALIYAEGLEVGQICREFWKTYCKHQYAITQKQSSIAYVLSHVWVEQVASGSTYQIITILILKINIAKIKLN